MVHNGSNTTDSSNDVQVMFLMFLAAFICLILISFMVATVAMKRKRSANNAGFIFKKDSQKDLKTVAKTYSNIWETFQTALAKNSCDMESSSLTDIFTR